MPLIELSMTGRPKSSRVVGIDLGTTNSLVAYMSDSGPQVIRDDAQLAEARPWHRRAAAAAWNLPVGG